MAICLCGHAAAPARSSAANHSAQVLPVLARTASSPMPAAVVPFLSPMSESPTVSMTFRRPDALAVEDVRQELAQFLAPAAAHDPPDEPTAQAAEARVFQHQPRAPADGLQRPSNGHHGAFLITQPTVPQPPGRIDLQDLAFDEPPPAELRLVPELELVPDPRREVVGHQP